MFFIIGLLLVGCAQSETTEEDLITEEQLLDFNITLRACENTECFLEAISACESVSFQRSAVHKIFGSDFHTTLNFEMFETDADCLVRVTLTDYEISPSDDMEASQNAGPGIEEVYEQLNIEARANLGKSGICNISDQKTEFTTIIEENADILLLMDGHGCEGALFEAFA